MNRLLHAFLVVVAILLAVTAVVLPAFSLNPSPQTWTFAGVAFLLSLALALVTCKQDLSYLFYSKSREER